MNTMRIYCHQNLYNYIYLNPCMLPLHMISPDHSLFTCEVMEIYVFSILLCKIIKPYFDNIMIHVPLAILLFIVSP